jgi:3-methyladenine DNA glycosylase AlkD
VSRPASADAVVGALVSAFEPSRDPERAAPMARYMRNRFEFIGIAAPQRRALQRPAFSACASFDEPALLATAAALWQLDEREYQYAACDLLIRFVRRLSSSCLPDLSRLITTKSWWDTVDALASRVVGSVVLADRSLDPVMDAWIDSDDLWLRRTALLHQLRWKSATDEARLFAFCARRADEPDFFIRKAIGWALREYARTAPEAVRSFVSNNPELSPLSRKEALKNLT